MANFAFKALFKPADAFLTVQRYSFFSDQPNLLKIFSVNFFRKSGTVFAE